MTAREALWPSLLPAERQGADDVCAVSAEGVRIRFADGVERVCATSGLWNVPLGYGNPVIADAIAEAAHRLSYGSVFRYENVDARRAAEDLVDLAGRDRYARVLFSTSGGAANDLAMKLVRQTQALRGSAGRRLVVGLRSSFHGLTFGGFSLTGEELGQEAYGVDTRLVRHLPPNDVEALEALFARAGRQVAAMVVEPVLGSGTLALTPEYVEAVARAREEHGFLLVADEVATGFARTGPMFASQTWPVAPDVLLLSKALTNGTCAAAAVLVAQPVADAFDRGGAVLVHAETNAGTAMSAAAISATLAEMQRLDVVHLAGALAGRLEPALDDLVARVPGVLGHVGVGCFRTLQVAGPDGALVTPADVPDLVAAVRREGAVVHPGVGGLQLVPAFVTGDDDLAAVVGAVERGVAAWSGAVSTAREVALA